MHSTVVGGAALNVRTLQRQLAGLLPGSRSVDGESTLELTTQGNDAPRLISATVLERDRLEAHSVTGECTPGFRAFLDGTQRSQVVSFVGSAPVVMGTVAAAVRERRDRRMHTWQQPLVEKKVYVPRAFLPSSAWSIMTEILGDDLIDTTEGLPDVISHPYALRDAAFHRVQSRREQVEQRLAERWCEEEGDALFIDGGISGSDRVAVSAFTIGVVKSHRTLYAEGEALATILALKYRERSSVFRITSTKRKAVASWYLRMRDPDGHDPMWGLIRAEIALPDQARMTELGPRADEVSRWILAEASPLALPDGRWDKMVYGVRDCEEFLRAITG
ncbi:MAG: hypothetical protein ABJE47_22830 [bacterium]